MRPVGAILGARPAWGNNRIKCHAEPGLDTGGPIFSASRHPPCPDGIDPLRLSAGRRIVRTAALRLIAGSSMWPYRLDLGVATLRALGGATSFLWR
jgi:hypothetical protein